MRIVDALLSIGAAMIALLVYLDIYVNQTLSGHLYLSIVLARHWTLQYMINIAGCMAILSQLSYKETAQVIYYFYIGFLVTSIAITDFPIMEDGWSIHHYDKHHNLRSFSLSRCGWFRAYTACIGATGRKNRKIAIIFFVVATGVVVYFVQACVENKMRPAFLGLFIIAVVIVGTGQGEAMMNTHMRRVIAATTLVLITNAITAAIRTHFG
ncbi:hypothetical protein PRIPAC_96384 [Pristionchus pacificus]|uniref:Uncharacterized protein n=1 Tax=Pristionchus pacificus TaxID=54126 RepID=A0A2A6BXQ8_PRIPA|nr:hypothetical protein PRIPAC_96384 [Pristionchus pacificus]|eukprot:PDM70668.1 hypothetical protein PRIPAC_43873 [Pristionchus pacificus]